MASRPPHLRLIGVGIGLRNDNLQDPPDSGEVRSGRCPGDDGPVGRNSVGFERSGAARTDLALSRATPI